MASVMLPYAPSPRWTRLRSTASTLALQTQTATKANTTVAILGRMCAGKYRLPEKARVGIALRTRAAWFCDCPPPPPFPVRVHVDGTCSPHPHLPVLAYTRPGVWLELIASGAYTGSLRSGVHSSLAHINHRTYTLPRPEHFNQSPSFATTLLLVTNHHGPASGGILKLAQSAGGRLPHGR